MRQSRKLLGAAAGVLGAVAATGCSGGSASIGAGPTGGSTNASWDYDDDGPVVAHLTVEAPEQEDFLLQATLPIPPGTWVPEQDATVPLAVLSSSDPTASPTQVEAVSRFANTDLGADVVEILANVRRPDVPPGTRIEYEVVYDPHLAEAHEPTPAVDSFFEAAGTLTLVGRDPFLHTYTVDLLQKIRSADPSVTHPRDGQLLREHALHVSMEPDSPTGGATGTLPHLFGVHAFVRTFAEEDFFAVDLHLHNGFDGLDESVTWDDTLDVLYFKDLELRLPDGWTVLHAFENPFIAHPPSSGPMQRVALVKPLANGDMHFVPRQGQFTRRLMIAKDGPAVDRARTVLESRGRGFCVQGVNDAGVELWSWWNAQTARFLPQREPLPDLSDLDSIENLRADLAAELWSRSEQVRTGDGGGYPVYSGALGWSHPWGVAYGGMTGGDEIEQYPGVPIAWAASQAGYRLTELQMKMYLERQPVALYAASGEPTKYDDLVVPDGIEGPYIPTSFNLTPSGSNDHFGYETAPRFQIDAVRNEGRAPGYEEYLADYDPIDLQHYIRYAGKLMTLAWLGNDSLAKEQLAASGELFRITFGENNNSNYGYIHVASLKKRLEEIALAPGTGASFGREHGWGLFLCTAAYAVGDDALRERWRPWIELQLRAAREGQSTCTGNITAKQVNKEWGGVYRTRQSFEMNYWLNASWSAKETVFRGVDSEMVGLLEDMVEEGAYASVTEPFWDPATNRQRRVHAVGPWDPAEGDFCGSWPADAFDADNRTEWDTGMTLWTYGYRLTGDDLFMLRASQAVGGTGNLSFEVEQLGLAELKSSAPLLALLQEMAAAN